MALLHLQQQQQQQQQQVHVGCGGVANGVSGTLKRIIHKLPITAHSGSSSSRKNNFVFSSSLTHLHQSGNLVTLDLFQSKLASVPVELDEPHPLPFGLQRFLDLKTGEIYYKDTRIMSQPKLDLKLNLSPPRVVNQQVSRNELSPNGSATSSPTSSCVSSEEAETEASMVLVGCPRCLMYVMLAEDDPKCPKCKSSVLLDFLQHQNNNSSKSKSKKTSMK